MWKRRVALKMTENDVTADEAYTALIVSVMQPGWVLADVKEYDARKDMYRIVVHDADNKKIDKLVPGETIARIVKLARMLARTGGPLLRPSDLAPKTLQ